MAKKAPTKDEKGRCGTYAGYAVHTRNGERACQPCLRAKRQQGREYRAKNKPASSNNQVPVISIPQIATAEKKEPAPDSASTGPRVNKPAEQHTDVPEDGPTPPEFLRARGREMWRGLTTNYKFTDAALVMAGEACRTVDRLERIAGALSSRTTMWFEIGDIELADEAGVPVVVNGMIGEARQLQSTLRQTLNQLGVVGVEAVDVAPQKSALDQLADRRAERLAGGEQ